MSDETSMTSSTFRLSLDTFSYPTALSVLLALLALAGCSNGPPDYFQGYVEGEYLYVSSPLAGNLEGLAVSRGEQVKAGQPLFDLEREHERAAAAEAEQNLRQAENRLADLEKGQRPSEIAALEAKLAQARIAFELAQKEYARRDALLKQNAIAQEQLDRSRTEKERGEAQIRQLAAELETARLGARPDQVAAARAAVAAAQERVAQAKWALAQKQPVAPQDGLVFDTYYVPGEFVPAARPVVSILPPGNVLVRFFVPEEAVAALAPGSKVSVRMDGSDRAYPAAISYISPQAEYTPPVIYSRETRAKLVYLIEARPAAADAPALHPGQPVEVRVE
ncbi:MAG: HlyD family secretion protein [Desulfobulbaceae bacterium]